MNDVLDREIRAAIADLLDTAPDVPSQPAPIAGSDATQVASERRRPLLTVAAVTIVLAGVLGLTQLRSRQEPVPQAEDPVPELTPEADSPPGIFLPAVVPDGYVVGSIDVLAQQTPSVEWSSRHFVRIDDGRPVASITLSVMAAPTSSTEPAPAGGPTVRGAAARSYDGGDGWVVSWVETDVMATVRASGFDEAAALAIAESTVVTGGLDPVIDFAELPAGFVESTGALPTPDVVSSMLRLVAVPAMPGAFIDVTAYPNIDGYTGDVLDVQSQVIDGSSERVTVRGHDTLLHTSGPDRFGTMVSLTWVEGTSIVTVQGRIPRDELLEFAETVGPSSLVRAGALRVAEIDALLALEERDRAVLPSGLDLGVVTDGSGAIGVCAFGRGSGVVCERYQTESVLAGERQDVVVATLMIDGEPVGVGWALGEHAPRVQESFGTSPLPDVVMTEVGTFFAVPLVTANGADVVFDEGADVVYNLAPGPESLLD